MERRDRRHEQRVRVAAKEGGSGARRVASAARLGDCHQTILIVVTKSPSCRLILVTKSIGEPPLPVTPQTRITLQ